jgi:hypothetical protein
MKFRIKHVLIATLVVAVFAYGLSFPTYYSERWFRFGAWAVAALLTVRAVARPAERKAIACGLITAASYLAVLAYYDQPTPLPTSAALDRVYPRNLPAGGSSGPRWFRFGHTYGTQTRKNFGRSESTALQRSSV